MNVELCNPYILSCGFDSMSFEKFRVQPILIHILVLVCSSQWTLFTLEKLRFRMGPDRD
jgi:hypothetical protein